MESKIKELNDKIAQAQLAHHLAADRRAPEAAQASHRSAPDGAARQTETEQGRSKL